MTDETIRAKLRPLIEKPKVADEDLIGSMSVAISMEAEQSNKFNLKGNSAKVFAVEGAALGNGKKDQQILTTLKAVQADLAAVQSEVKTLWETASSQKTDAIRSNHAKNETSARASPRGCQECKRKREGDRCSHCYFCGGSNQYCHARYPRRAGSSHTRERKLPPVYGCLKFDCHMELLQCSACQSVCYFFVQCQKAHWPKHKVLCKAIKELEKKRCWETPKMRMCLQATSLQGSKSA